ncbi:hypothetical protein MTsPCn9_02190 [Croceitalea sp. MTPC9]|uniref:c-type cytochrome n=1 Tax=unclassified Croceitalea TaxID=2632280 RepID=UPI002B3E1A28|nr:hypothetical protein MTsPCn6_06520 [Croceitalea sp. MTPC6]GMN15283.1 hypothetical protein MTsPCn9_02190 [Croceitalea sp. MTPC9]
MIKQLLLLTILFLLSNLNLQAQNIDLNTSISRGKNVYLKKCAVCHSKDGLGKGKRIPPLANSDYLFNNREASIRGILFGQSEKITVNGIVYNRKMKAIKLSNQEVADVMNYIQNSWGNKNDITVSDSQVQEVRLKFSKGN